MSEKAIPILESLQIEAYRQQVGSFDPKDPDVSQGLFRALSKSSLGEMFTEAQLRRVHESQAEALQSILQTLPTAYEDPHAYVQLNLVSSRVAEAAEELGYSLPETLSLGTIPSGSINAHVISLESSEYLLVINRDLLKFTDLFSRFVASRIAGHIGNYFENQSPQNTEPSDSDVDFLTNLAYFLINRIEFVRDDTGTVGHAFVHDIHLDPPLAELSSLLSKTVREQLFFSMTAFAVGHEFAHIIRSKSPPPPTEKGGGEWADFYEELACDAIGCRIAAQAAARECIGRYKPGWQMLGTAGSLFFLSCFGLMQKAAYVFQWGPDLPRVVTEPNHDKWEANVLFSYPTAIFRRYIARTILEDDFQRGGTPNAGDWIFGPHDWTAAFFDQCWDKMRADFAERFEWRKAMHEHMDEFLRER